MEARGRFFCFGPYPLRERNEEIVSKLGDIDYRKLHNNLRYPFYSSKFDIYSIVSYTADDYRFVENVLFKLKAYSRDLNRI